MTFDVVVVGASTAGLYAAQMLAEGGLEVAVFERALRHEPARRTLIVTPAFGEVLNSGIPKAVEIHRSGTMRVAAGDAELDVEFRLPDPIIERGEMTRRLSVAAEQAGARIFYGWRFLGFSGSRIRFECRERNKRSHSSTGEHAGSGALREVEEVEFVSARRAVIGSDGVLTDVGPAAGIGRPPAVPILQAEVNLPPGWDPDVTQVWFDVDDTPYFYWLIPESDSRGVVGLIGEPRAKMRQLLEKFLKTLRSEFSGSGLPASPALPSSNLLSPNAFQSSQVAMHHPRFRPWAEVYGLPVLLVGDAAGQVKVTTVGGTVTGFRGAQAAVRSILKRVTYQSELRSLKRELDVHFFMRLALERLDNHGYRELVRLMQGALGEFLGRYHRDQMARVFWKLPFVEPRLFRLGVRCLLGR